MAKHLEVSPTRFHQWLNVKSQKNLWEHLPKLLELFPDVNRQWLYLGDGAAFQDGSGPETAPSSELKALQTRVAELEAELTEANRLNRQLVTRLFVDGAGDKGASITTAKSADEAS